jgi:hypothetical protein
MLNRRHSLRVQLDELDQAERSSISIRCVVWWTWFNIIASWFLICVDLVTVFRGQMAHMCSWRWINWPIWLSCYSWSNVSSAPGKKIQQIWASPFDFRPGGFLLHVVSHVLDDVYIYLWLLTIHVFKCWMSLGLVSDIALTFCDCL